MRQKIAAGNWKMNGLAASLGEIEALKSAPSSGARIIICPPFTLLLPALEIARGSDILIGAQNAHQEASGAYTGEVSAPMLADLGCSHVIIGHSERRQYFGEAGHQIAGKIEAALKAGLAPIYCVGESLEEREAGQAQEIVGAQIASELPDGASGENFIIAYEPVWAIGTGKTPSGADIAEMHGFIRGALKADADKTPILYGGSVKGENASEIFAIPNVDGGLVGGASLTAKDFQPIIEAAGQAAKS